MGFNSGFKGLIKQGDQRKPQYCSLYRTITHSLNLSFFVPNIFLRSFLSSKRNSFSHTARDTFFLPR